MSVVQFASISFERYALLLRASITGFHSLAVYAPDGSAIYNPAVIDSESTGGNPANAAKIFAALDLNELYSATSPNDKDIHCLAMGIYDIHHQNLALVLIELKVVEPQSEVSNNDIQLFTTIVESITDEVKLNSELESMTAALGKSYEELNLIYQAKEIVEDDEGLLSDGLKNLDKLVRDYTTSLEVGFGLICFPQKNIQVTHGSFSETVPGGHELKLLTANFFEHLENNRTSVVLNELDDPVHQAFKFSLHCRYMLIPAFSHDFIVDGFIFICKSLSAPEFTNADRRLVEMLSNMASKIIQSQYDILTGLSNRLAFENTVNSLLKHQEKEHPPPQLLLLNIQHFKIVNDTCGQSVGNKLLCGLATIIQQTLTEQDAGLVNLTARIDADEFAILLINSTLIQAKDIATAITAKVANYTKEFQRLPAHCNFNVRIGIVEHNPDLEDFTQWMARADIACNLARNAMNDTIHVYANDDMHFLQRRSEMDWFDRVKQAANRGRLSLYCQYILPLQGGRQHYEILLRVKDDEGQLTSPVEFINAAERYGLMVEIDKWVIARALKLLSAFQTDCPHEKIIWSLNLSGQSIGCEGFLEYILDQVSTSNIDCQNLCFEVTETAAIDQFDLAMELIETLKKMGCRFSLDDFGSGLSSFSYLQQIPIDNLKIDGIFVKSIVEDDISLNMVKAMHSISTAMGLVTIAEFVETDDILIILRKLGIDYAQGYAIHKPEPLEDVLKRIKCEVQ